MSKSDLLQDLESFQLFLKCESVKGHIPVRTYTKALKFLEDLEKDIVVTKERLRHDWEFIKQLERNKLYRCRNCGEEMEGNLDQVLCGSNCQHEVHFCKEKGQK